VRFKGEAELDFGGEVTTPLDGGDSTGDIGLRAVVLYRGEAGIEREREPDGVEVSPSSVTFAIACESIKAVSDEIGSFSRSLPMVGLADRLEEEKEADLMLPVEVEFARSPLSLFESVVSAPVTDSSCLMYDVGMTAGTEL